MKSTGEQYRDTAVELAAIIGKLQEIKNTCEFLKDNTNDNGDPYYDMEPVLMHAGIALASMVTYADEYMAKELESPVERVGKKGEKE